MPGKMAIVGVLLLAVPVVLGVLVWLYLRARLPLGPRFEWGISRLGGACCLALAFVLAIAPFIFAVRPNDQGPLFTLVGGPVIGLVLLGVLFVQRAWQLVRWLGLLLMALAVAAGPTMYYMRGIVLSAGTGQAQGSSNAEARGVANVFVINIIVCVAVFFTGLAIFGIGSALRKRQPLGKNHRRSESE